MLLPHQYPVSLIFFTIGIITITAAGESTGTTLQEGIERAKAATVGILRHSEDPSPQATKTHFSVRGTGVHIGGGYILTARHAVERRKGGKFVTPGTITVLTNNLEEIGAVFIGVNAFIDIAVYQIDPTDPPLLLGSASLDEKEPQSGEEVFTVGYPLGWGPAMGFGHVGNPHIFLPTVQTRLIQVDLPACSGNSGGGLFNTKGRIVGIIQSIIPTETTQGERRCSRFSFAIPGPLAKRIATALIEGKSPGFSKLGGKLTAVKIGPQWQVVIAKATGPARKGGLRKGDVILFIEDTAISSAAQLKSYLIEHTHPGEQVEIRVLRNQGEKTLQVILGKW